MLQLQTDTPTTTRWQPRVIRHDHRAGSVGIVQRQYAHFDETLHLRSGGVLQLFHVWLMKRMARSTLTIPTPS